MHLKLVEPNTDYEHDFMEMLNEFKDSGGAIPFVMHFNKDVFQDILLAAIENSKGANVTPNMEASTTWWLCDSENRLIGIVNIRHSLNEYLENFGGHIGYGIRPLERQKGYATQLLSLALDKCKEMGLERVLITCAKENIASQKVILKNGGLFEDEKQYEGINILRYWIAIS